MPGSGAAIALSTIAIQQAHDAEINSCKTIISNFDSHNASISSMQQYSKCVDVVYPNEISVQTIITYKILFIIALFGMFYGFYKAYKANDGFDFTDTLIYGLMGLIIAPTIAIVGAAISFGIIWLFK